MYTDWHGSAQGPVWIKPQWPETVVRGLFSFRTYGTSRPPFDALNVGLHVGDEPEYVLANRQRVAEELGGSVDEWVVGAQVHGTAVAVVEDLPLPLDKLGVSVPGGHALVKAQTEKTLVVMAADCVPVIFFDPIQRVIATAHSGWKGTVGHIVAHVVEVMKERFQSAPGTIEVWLGPSIRQCCYEVDDKVADQIREEFGANPLWARTAHPGKYWLNLQSCIRKDLLAAGVESAHIHDSGVCTASHPELLFSHRAERGRTGRLLGAVRLASNR